MVFSFDVLGITCLHVSSSLTIAIDNLLTGVVDLGRVRYRSFDRLACRTVVPAGGEEL